MLLGDLWSGDKVVHAVFCRLLSVEYVCCKVCVFFFSLLFIYMSVLVFGGYGIALIAWYIFTLVHVWYFSSFPCHQYI